jgi:lysophospholipase L1-like esterase
MAGYTRFIALGDSFTEGMQDEKVNNQYRGWADRVAEALASQTPGFTYLNLAVRGKLVGQVIDDQIPAALRWIEGPSTLVSFHAGANDLLRPSYDPNVVLPRYREAIKVLAATGCQLMVFTAIERVAKSGKMQALWEERFSAFNKNVREMAAQYNAIVLEATNDPDIGSRRFLDKDRLHLNPAGHYRVAQGVLQKIGGPHDPHWREDLPPQPQRSFFAKVYDDVRWVLTFLIPWMSRRIRGVSSGDGRSPKHVEPIKLS